ncbi:MAG: glycerol-3-phosphate dehydrogenase [Clostridia bacterium]|nr:glycerol-3-phosphate dehydrogenase [Clostridia bacterium]
MKFTVLGTGRWGTFITWYLAFRRYTVTEWGRPGSRALAALMEKRENEYVKIPDSVNLTDNIGEAISDADVVIIAIKSQALRELATLIKEYGALDKKIVLCMKGIEEDSGLRLTEIMQELGYDKNRLTVWVGPGHIQEFVNAKPNCMVIDGYNPELVRELCDALKSPLIRFYYGDDIIGSEIGAAAKNVIGIAAGILDGGGMASLKGPLMARGAREVARLIHAMGGNELSAYGLCHLGDYETTLFSPYSNNRNFGESIAKGEKFEKLAEGVYTAKGLKLLGEKYGVDMPITNAVYRVLYEDKNPFTELFGMFDRRTVTEFVL